MDLARYNRLLQDLKGVDISQAPDEEVKQSMLALHQEAQQQYWDTVVKPRRAKEKAMATKKANTADGPVQVAKAVERDAYGFGTQTVGCFVMQQLVDGKCTRKELEKMFFSTEFHAWGRGNEIKRTATSLSVFLSDVKKPFGQYHAARSLIIIEDPETHKLMVEPKRLAAIEKAVANGIIDELKGLTPKEHLAKIKVIRKKHGVPVE